MAEKDPIEQLKASFAGQKFDDASPDPGADANDDLEGQIEETAEAVAEAGSEEGGEVDPAEETADTELDPLSPEAIAKAEAEVLKGEQLIKLQSGEFISKKAFLKRLSKESTKRKELEEKFKPFEKYETKKDFYERWEKNSEAFENSAKALHDLNTGLQREAWLTPILQKVVQGQPINWAEVTSLIKPMLAPFWEGTAVEEADPATQTARQLAKMENELRAFRTAQVEGTQTQERQARIAQRESARLTEEQGVWKRYKEFNNDLYRDALYDKALAIQSQMPPGQTVSLEKIADEFFGGLKKLNLQRAEEARKRREKGLRAGAERGSGRPGLPVEAEPRDTKPKSEKEIAREKVFAVIGGRPKRFDD